MIKVQGWVIHYVYGPHKNIKNNSVWVEGLQNKAKVKLVAEEQESCCNYREQTTIQQIRINFIYPEGSYCLQCVVNVVKAEEDSYSLECQNVKLKQKDVCLKCKINLQSDQTARKQLKMEKDCPHTGEVPKMSS